jgi:hypothetical protein
VIGHGQKKVWGYGKTAILPFFAALSDLNPRALKPVAFSIDQNRMRGETASILVWFACINPDELEA